MQNKFYNANEVFNHFWFKIRRKGVKFDNTLAMFNVGFEIKNPLKNDIEAPWRNWNKNYAEAEWQWYLSGDRNIHKLGDLYGKVPPIWTRMADEDGNVNSNYGWQWKRNDQLQKVIDMLSDENTRQAAISIYDGKEIHAYDNDTPCTYAVQFTIMPKTRKLNMAVVMRSNDLWFGFCNDQYCFANLQMLVAYELGIDVGEYYHYAHNLHLYNNKL